MASNASNSTRQTQPRPSSTNIPLQCHYIVSGMFITGGQRLDYARKGTKESPRPRIAGSMIFNTEGFRIWDLGCWEFSTISHKCSSKRRLIACILILIYPCRARKAMDPLPQEPKSISQMSQGKCTSDFTSLAGNLCLVNATEIELTCCYKETRSLN